LAPAPGIHTYRRQRIRGWGCGRAFRDDVYALRGLDVIGKPRNLIDCPFDLLLRAAEIFPPRDACNFIEDGIGHELADDASLGQIEDTPGIVREVQARYEDVGICRDVPSFSGRDPTLRRRSPALRLRA
jgi:hypothetical protein